MRIDVFDHVAGARAARGTAVIIDVFRAFSVAAYAFDAGAARVLPVGEIDAARDWSPREDFDYCTEVDRFDFVLRAKRVPGEPLELERVAAP
jgi:phosphosulfolactate phosphohydrolase-like enzyme